MDPPPQSKASLIQIGRWLRGALGYGLREVTCVGLCSQEQTEGSEDKSCFEPSCAYARGFLALGTDQGAPAPFRFTPTPASHRDDPTLTLTLSLFGALSEDHLLWLWALQRSARRGLGPNELRYLLTSAVDTVDQELIWSLAYSTFPILPQVAELASLLPPRPRSKCQRLTLSFVTPLETKKSLGEGSGAYPQAPSLNTLINLIVRRLEALAETYLYPIESEEPAPRLTRRALEWLTEGTSTYRANWRASSVNKGRGEPRWTGLLTYELPSDPERIQLMADLIHAGSIIGIGRGGVEGLGSYSYSWS